MLLVRIQPKTIQYKDYHQFSPDAFTADLIKRNLNSLPASTSDPNEAYAKFCDAFKTILDEHAPKGLRGNHAPSSLKSYRNALWPDLG